MAGWYPEHHSCPGSALAAVPHPLATAPVWKCRHYSYRQRVRLILPFEDAVGSATVVISLEWDLRRKLEVVIDLDGQEPCLGEGIASQHSDRQHNSAVGSER